MCSLTLLSSPQPVMSQPYPVPIPIPQPNSRGIPDTLNLFFFGKHMRFGLFFIVKCVTKSSGEQLKVLTPYFLCLHISEIPVTIKGQISYNNESNQKS